MQIYRMQTELKRVQLDHLRKGSLIALMLYKDLLGKLLVKKYFKVRTLRDKAKQK